MTNISIQLHAYEKFQGERRRAFHPRGTAIKLFDDVRCIIVFFIKYALWLTAIRWDFTFYSSKSTFLLYSLFLPIVNGGGVCPKITSFNPKGSIRL
jgi:hypothetical protein